MDTMGDAGEGLVDAESRIQERLEEVARERAERRQTPSRDPEEMRTIESLRLARIELERQREATAHEQRRTVLTQAITELDRRLASMLPG
jgi:hypothetical protein